MPNPNLFNLFLKKLSSQVGSFLVYLLRVLFSM